MFLDELPGFLVLWSFMFFQANLLRPSDDLPDAHPRVQFSKVFSKVYTVLLVLGPICCLA